MLPVDVVERIKAKETAQVAAREERRKKKSGAEKLADAVRREELRQISKANRTAEEQREFARLEARRYRANESKVNTLADVPTAQQFWDANRLLVTGQKLKAWKEEEERLLDILCWMNSGWAESPHSPCFVGIDESLAGIDAHVTQYGLIHDDPLTFKHIVLQDFRPPWGVWCPRDRNDDIWGWVGAFFKDAERFKALCSESPATEIYARYGIMTAVPAYHLRRFRQRIAEHKNGDHRNEADEKCWLCQFARLNGTVQL